MKCSFELTEKYIQNIRDIRSRQDSNLRGRNPLDFKSNALTTRPRLLLILIEHLNKEKICITNFYMFPLSCECIV